MRVACGLYAAKALRQQAWGAPSQACGPGSLPRDAAVQQQPQPVVGEVAEAVPDPLDLLDQQVDGLSGPIGAAIGGVEGEDLDLPRLTVRASLDNSATLTPSDQR
jgi:hypothetical protein